MPEKRLPLLETAAFDFMAHLEGMLRQARFFQREVNRIRELLDSGNRDQASLMLTEGAVVAQMEELRQQSSALIETIDLVESLLAEERAARQSDRGR
jgi:hypothetical protein